ncbi:hypothetical protein Daesc_007682 [Daldinia eschscholtzii]|uniref:Apple domain-containing protein n=1 Tax=Daldinia eschscholtzii TaxID=292717 RepID=A0AAX6MG47_9PEZI
MRASSSIVAVAVLVRGVFSQCTDGLAVLAGTQEIVEQCAPKASTDAVSLCSSLLGTSTFFAVPPSKTALTTTTELATRTVTRVVFTTTTTTETEIILSTSSTTVFATPSPGPVNRREAESNGSPVNSPASAASCPTLTSLPTGIVSSSAITSACGCLGASAAVSTVSDGVSWFAALTMEKYSSQLSQTTTSTITESKMTVSTKTITSTIVTFTKSTTTTIVAMATQTMAYDRCSVGYSPGGNGKGNQAEYVQANSSQDCCQQCQQKQNCVASVYTGTMCQLLIKVAQLSGAITSDKCPLGVEDYPFGPAGGMVYPGPCGF